MRISEPRWIKPRLASPGQTFPVIASACAHEAHEVFEAQLHDLERGGASPLDVLAVEPLTDLDAVCVRCRAPDDLAPGLRSLTLRIGDRAAHVPNCVQVLDDPPTAYTFVHASDIHIWKPDKTGGFHDRTRAVQRMVAAINDLGPAFVVNTGDLISRYRTHAADPVTAAELEQQTIAVRQALLALRVAMFVTPGNHDVAFPAARSAWERHMGLPPADGRDDYSFNFAGDHFTVLDASRRYDERTGKATDDPFTPEQLDWLARDLSAAGDDAAGHRFLFFHYDYRQQLNDLLRPLGVGAVFYGHSNKRTFTAPQPNGFIEGLLPSAQAYQLVHVGADGVRIERGPTWRELDA